MGKLIKSRLDFWNLVFSVVFLTLVVLLTAFLLGTGKIPRSLGASDALLLVFATFRIIRLFTYDKITAFLREYLAESSSGCGQTLHSLIICPWCTGAWASLAVVSLFATGEYGYPALLVLAVAGAASLVQITANVIVRTPERK